MPTITPAALRPADAATYLGVRPKTLANWRSLGIGPAYKRAGDPGSTVLYRVVDLDAWLAEGRIR